MMRRTVALALAVAVFGAGASAAQSLSAPPIKPEHERYSAEIATAQQRLDAFMKAFNARDIPAYEATLHFPHIRFHGGAVTTLNRGDHTPQMYQRESLKEWRRSAWLRREVIHAGPDKVHIDTRFARYRGDGSLIGAFDSIYIVTRVNGVWNIQARSSFAP